MSIGKRWRESDTVKFVELYEKAECLWNYRHPVYKHRQARDKAIQHIIEEMNMPDFGVNELKNKIKNIRSTYQQEVNKIKRSKNFGPDIMEEYKTNLAWFPIADRFLSKVINSTKNPLPKVEEDDAQYFQTNQSSFYSLVETEMSNGDGSNEVEEKYPPYTINIEQIKEEIDKDEYSPPNVQNAKRKKTIHQPGYSNIEQGLEENDVQTQSFNDEVDNDEWYHYENGLQQTQRRLEESDIVVQSTVDDLQKDEWYHFGNNISCQLRSLPLERALVCQKKIIDLLTQERLDYIKQRKNDGTETKKSE